MWGGSDSEGKGVVVVVVVVVDFIRDTSEVYRKGMWIIYGVKLMQMVFTVFKGVLISWEI